MQDTNERSDKYLIVMSGGSGSGKGVAMKFIAAEGIISGNETVLKGKTILGDNPVYKEMREYHRHPEKTDQLRELYYSNLSRLGQNAIDAGDNIIIDDHLDNPDAITPLIKSARDKGYNTLFLGFSASPQAAFGVYDLLSEETGKTADYEWMITSYKDFSIRFGELTSFFDLSLLFYRDLGEAGRAIYIADSANQKTTILDETNYERFEQWQNARTDARTPEEVFQSRGTAEIRNSGRGNNPRVSRELSSVNFDVHGKFAAKVLTTLSAAEISL